MEVQLQGKQAELRGAVAKADSARKKFDRIKGLIANGAVEARLGDEAEAAVRVAESELETKKTEVQESEVRLKQAKRRIEATPTDRRADSPAAPSTPADLRDAVELLEVQLQAKQAELQGAEAKADLERRQLDRIKGLNARGAVEPQLVDEQAVRFGVAEAGVKSKMAEVTEVKLRLTQAKRRAGSIEPAQPDRRADSPAASSTLADLRDAVEVMEAQLQGKMAELRGAEAKAKSAKAAVDFRESSAREGRITQTVWLETQAALQAAQTELDVKVAEVQEFEVRLKQAKRRVEAEDARLKREVERARAELARTEILHKQGAVSIGEVETARARFDELMFQLDPKYVPDPARK